MIEPSTNGQSDAAGLPVGWRRVRLGEVVSRRKESVQPQDYPEAPYVGLRDIDSHRSQLTRWGQGSDVRSTKYKFYEGDVLYGKLRPYLDKAVLAELGGICSTDIIVFTAGEEIRSDFLIHLVHSREFRRLADRTTHGVNHPRTKWTSLQKFEFALPPFPEQQTIVRALRTVQHSVEARRRERAVERERRAALLQHILTHGTRDEPRIEVPIGDLPKRVPHSWQVVPLAEMISEGPRNGLYKPKHLYGEGIPIIRIDDFDNDGRFVSRDFSRVRVSAEEIQKFAVAEADRLNREQPNWAEKRRLRDAEAGKNYFR